MLEGLGCPPSPSLSSSASPRLHASSVWGHAPVLPALLGVVLVAQLPSHQPEVVFKRLSESVEEKERLSPSDVGSAGGRQQRKASWGGSSGEEDCRSESNDPSCGVAQPPTPQSATIAERLRRQGLGLPQLPSGSAEDLRRNLRECFGIPAAIFAKLMLPDEELCNRPFYLEIDAGRRQTSHPHGPWSHLLFVSFPCNVAEFSRPRVVEGRRADFVHPNEKVQRFNVVHVLDSRLAGRREKHTSTLWQVSAHLSRALVSEEVRCGYLSKEVQRLSHAPMEEQLHMELKQSGEISSAAFPDLAALGLDRLLADMFDGVHDKGYGSLRVNGSILCQVCVFPKHEAPAPPSPGQALALSCAREELQQELPLDAADIVRRVVDAVDPSTSLAELMVRLALPLGTLQRVAQHLVYWKKARVVEPFGQNTRVVVAPGVDTDPHSRVAREFQEWHQQNKTKAPGPQLSFSEVLSAFSGGRTLESAKNNLRKVVEFRKVLAWLVARGLLMQLATYYHFLPRRDAACSAGASSIPRLTWPSIAIVIAGSDLRRDYCPDRLTEDELRLLSSRAGDQDELRFLCRFVAEFVRGHCRVDGCRFAALFDAAPERGRPMLSKKKAEKLLADNKDILVPYVCCC